MLKATLEEDFIGYVNLDSAFTWSQRFVKCLLILNTLCRRLGVPVMENWLDADVYEFAAKAMKERGAKDLYSSVLRLKNRVGKNYSIGFTATTVELILIVSEGTSISIKISGTYYQLSFASTNPNGSLCTALVDHLVEGKATTPLLRLFEPSPEALPKVVAALKAFYYLVYGDIGPGIQIENILLGPFLKERTIPMKLGPFEKYEETNGTTST